MDAKLRKSLVFSVLFIIGVGLSIISNVVWDQSDAIQMSELREVGYYDIQKHQSIIYNRDLLSVSLNDKKKVNNFYVRDNNESPTLYLVPTTFIPNRDAFFIMKEWEVPEFQDNNLNYFSIQNMADSSAYYIPAIHDFEKVSQGYPIVFIYIDSLDYFSDSTGIYVPGLNKEMNNLKKDGNYAKRGKEWERKVYYQLFKGSGKLIDEGWAGSRIHGNLSRAAPQKSLRFYARKKYGNKNFISPYADSSLVERFILRSPFSSNRELIYKDAMISNVAITMGMDAMRSTPVKVYLNGEYWGYHNFRDRVDEDFFFERYPIDTLDYLDLYSKAKYGSGRDYLKLSNWMNHNDLRLDANYEELLNYVDIDNYTRYLLIEFYFGNKDWPHNNVRIWKSSELDNKWRWLIFDLDAAGKDSVDMAQHIINKGDTKFKFWGKNLFFGLMANDVFYKNMVDTYLELRDNEMSVKTLVNKSDSLKELYMPLLPEQITRWGFPSSIEHFEEVHTNFNVFLEYRDQVILEELERIHNYSILYQDNQFAE